jgi:hypothetical protein
MSFAMNIPLTGEFASPDRMHMTIEVRSLGFSGELVSIGGQVWTRAAGEPWDRTTSSQFGTPVNPAQMSRMNPAQMLAILVDPVVTDAGRTFHLSGGVDMQAALTMGPAGTSVFGDNMMDTSYMDLVGATGQLSMTVTKATQYVEFMELTMSLPVNEPEGTIGMRVSMSFSDYNNPAIRVDSPVL